LPSSAVTEGVPLTWPLRDTPGFFGTTDAAVGHAAMFKGRPGARIWPSGRRRRLAALSLSANQRLVHW
jgi:hypothetical protein